MANFSGKIVELQWKMANFSVKIAELQWKFSQIGVKNSRVVADKNKQLVEFPLKNFEQNLIKGWENDELSNIGLQSCSLFLSRRNTNE